MSDDPSLPQVLVYTDGGCDPNPGPGGWGAVLVWGSRTKEISGAEQASTNNRMELAAAISALRTLREPCEVTLYTDSQYLRRGITQWLPRWQEKGWRTARGQPVENQDLWVELLAQTQRHHIAWRWVKGHVGDPLNERADRLAREALKRLLAGSRKGGRNRTQASEPVAEGLPEVEIYARGCSLGTPGPGGYAALLVFSPNQTQVVSGSWPMATNNVMELWAAVAGVQALRRRFRVTLYTVSKYVHDGATRWMVQWERRGWHTKDGKPVKHREIWLELGHAMGDHDVTWVSLPQGKRNDYAARAARVARTEAEKAKASTRLEKTD